MAALNELIQKIENPELRAQIQAATDRMIKEKKFGLVFEEHLPECTPLYDIPVSVLAKLQGQNLTALVKYRKMHLCENSGFRADVCDSIWKHESLP